MIYLKKAVGVLYHEDQLDIEVVARGFSEVTFLGGISLTGISQKDPLVIKSELEEFLAKLKVKPDNVVVGLSPDQLAFRHLTLPAEAEENLDQAIRLQVMNIIPSEVEDFAMEKIVRRGADGKSYEVDLYIIPREKVRKILELLKSLGLSPPALTLTSFGFEKLLRMRKRNLHNPIFLADLDLNNFSVYAFQEGQFSYFKLAWINPASKNIQNVLKEVERCASLVRVNDEDDIEMFVNVSAPNWEEKLVEGSYAFISYAKEFSPFQERTTHNIKPLAVAIQALAQRRRSVNLIPPEGRERSSSMTLLPTVVLAAGILIVLGLIMGRGFFQDSEYVDTLEKNIAKISRDYRNVMQLRRDLVRARGELDSYQDVIKGHISDLEILKELTEKAGEKTYLSEYVRADNLILSGYTDSVLDLQTRLGAIRFFKTLNLQGSITKTKEGLEHFRFEIQLEEKP